MREQRSIMGMPISVDILGASKDAPVFADVFAYFTHVDEVFSTYKPASEISRINRAELPEKEWSAEMREVFDLAEQTKQETNGFFDISKPDGSIDPSGIVKGWAIRNAAKIISSYGFEHFYVEAGGDIEVRGQNAAREKWRVGIRSPFNLSENIKVVHLSNAGIATSGNYERGKHIYVPQTGLEADAVASITIIGPDACEADRCATAAFAMGVSGIQFIESRPGLEGYMIDKQGIATMTSGFERYVEE